MIGIKLKFLVRHTIFVCITPLLMLLSSCDVGLFLERFTPDIRLTDDHYLLSTDGFRYSLESDDTNTGVLEYIVAYLLTDKSIYLVQMTAQDSYEISLNTDLPKEVLICNYHEFNHLTDRNTLHVNSAEWLESLRNEIPDLASAADFKTLSVNLDLYCLQRVSWD